MTWRVRGKLKGLMCFHVDDIMISGPKNDPEFKRVQRLYEWGEWERNEFHQCGYRVRQATDKSVTVDQECYARQLSDCNVRTPTQTHDRNLV